MPLIAKFGQGDRAKGWQMTIGLWAIVCVILFIITFLSTRERILPDPEQKATARQDFGGLLKNGPWIAMFVLTLIHFTYVAMRSGAIFYYFQYYVNKDSLFQVLQTLGLTNIKGGGLWHYLMNTFGLVVDAERKNVSSVGFSLFNISSQLVLVIGVLSSTFLSIRFGKKAVALVGFFLATIFMALFILLPANAIGALLVLEYLRALSYGPTIPLLWAMFADVVDYAEWKTGRRTTGLVYATIMFALKAGLSLGVAIAGWVLSAYGYVPNVAQTPTALLGIRMTISIFPAICFLIVLACLFSYPIGKKLNLQIQDELAERRKKFATN